MDGLIGQLVTGLETAELLNCVNLIIVADHGMAGGGPGWVIKLSDYISDVYDSAYTYTGAFTRIDPKNESDGKMPQTFSRMHPN
jgi:predicted AlkP superfamily pyrophosphatase or phosphodiesterase